MLDSLGSPVSIYQPEQPGVIFPAIPEFACFAEERDYRKRHLVAACRAFAMHGFDYGFAGHLTVRDPERPDLYWTNPMCVHFSQVRMSNLILADHKGTIVEGRYAINRAGFVLHSAVHEAHPDIVAMCHAPRCCMDPPLLLARVRSLQADPRLLPEGQPCRSNSTPNTAIIFRSRAIGLPTGRTMTPRCASEAV